LATLTRSKLKIQKFQPLPHPEQRDRKRQRGEHRPRAVRPPAHKAALLRRPGQLQPITPPAYPLKDLVEGRLAAVIESARFHVCLSVCFSRFAIAQNESLVFCDVLVVETAESPTVPIGRRIDMNIDIF
jgi:hypothetical protein